MANRQFNSVDGYTVGNADNLITIITSNGAISATELSANGNVSFTGANVSLGNITSIKISGGSSGQIISTDGAGNLSWISGSGGSSTSISNGNSNVNISTSGGNVTTSVGGNTNVLIVTSTGANVTGNLFSSGGLISRSVTLIDSNSISLSYDSTDLAVQFNTQIAGTLTINEPTGTSSPLNGQKIMLRIKSVNIQTFSWNSVFVGSSDMSLPVATTGSNLTDYMGFIYDSVANKWHMIAKNFGF